MAKQTGVLITKEYGKIAMSNMFAIALHEKPLSRAAQRVEAWLISQIKQNDKAFTKYRIPANIAAEILKQSQNSSYETLNEVATELLKHVIKIKEGKKHKQYSLISSSEYHSGEGWCEISIHPDLKPYLLELKNSGGFTVLDFDIAQSFEKQFSYPLYKILKSYLHKNINDYVIDMEIDILKSMLGCSKSYNNYANFRIDLLDPIKKEIKKKSDISFEYESSKKLKKRVISLKFFIHRQDTHYTADVTKIELDPLEEKLISLGFQGDFKQLCNEVPYNAIKYYTAVILEDKIKNLKVKNKSEFIYIMITSNAEMIYNMQSKSLFVEQEDNEEISVLKNELIAFKITSSVIDDILKNNEMALLKKVINDTRKAVNKGGVDNEAAFFISKLKSHKKAEELKQKKDEESKKKVAEKRNALLNKLSQFKTELLNIYSTRIESGIVKDTSEAFLQDWNMFKEQEQHKLTCMPDGTTTIDYLNTLRCIKIDDLSNEDLYMFLKWKGFYM